MDYQTLKPLAFYNPINQCYNQSRTSSYNIQGPKITYAKKVDYSVM